MSNRYGAIRAAERLISRYRNTSQFLKCNNEWKTCVRANSTGWKALRLAGYLTGMGVFK